MLLKRILNFKTIIQFYEEVLEYRNYSFEMQVVLYRTMLVMF